MALDPVQETQASPERILRRIDAIIQELQALRQVVLEQKRSSEPGLAAQLYGALGQGTWDEYDPESHSCLSSEM